MTALDALLLALWQFLPAWFANSCPLAVSKLIPEKLRIPIDLGLRFPDGNRLLGDGKTVPGFIAGVAAGLIVGLLQGNALLGALLGLGAMSGDTLGSFVRRRMGLPRGADVPILNQLDFVAGALFLSYPARAWSLPEIAVICVLTVPVHRITNWAAHKMGIKGEPW